MSVPKSGVILATDAIAQRDNLRFNFVGVGAEGEREAFSAKHIPGAAFIGVREAFSGEAAPEKRAFPLPSAEQLGARLAAAGIAAGDAIVVYAAVPAWASRAWWVLRWPGLDAQVLIGRLAAWGQAGGPLSSQDDAPAAASAPLVLTTGEAVEIDLETLLASLGQRPLIDARVVAMGRQSRNATRRRNRRTVGRYPAQRTPIHAIKLCLIR